jgi:hypothetical protein
MLLFKKKNYVGTPMDRLLTGFFVCFFFAFAAFAQEPDEAEEEGFDKADLYRPMLPDDTYKPILLKIDESGKKYIRFINWNQFAVIGESVDGKPRLNAQLKRVRFLMHSQVNDKFMILTHFGVNNVGSADLHPTGQSAQVKLFLHDAWTEYKIAGEYLTLGAGLHYFNGLSRATNQGTLNFLTFDNYRQAWSQLGLSDQFGRHLGVFAKGRFGKLNYHFAVNDALVNSIDVPTFDFSPGSIGYVGRKYFPEIATMTVQGYFDYQFLDQESNKLPYRVGSHLGNAKVFNVGFGFFAHPNGMVRVGADSTVATQDVRHFSFDVFYDTPLANGGALTLYGAYYDFKYGEDYFRDGLYGTAASFYGHIGYLFPHFSTSFSFMPYIAYSSRDFEFHHNHSHTVNLGTNLFILGHNAKVTFEYRIVQPSYNESRPVKQNQLILQTMIFI